MALPFYRTVILAGGATLALSTGWLLHLASTERSLLRSAEPHAPLPRARPVAPAQPAKRTHAVDVVVDASSAAAGRSDALPAPPLGDDDALRAWARNDPQAAARWLATAPPGLKRDVVLEIVCLEIAEYDAPDAVAIADRFGYPGMNLRENLVAQWAERDAVAAKAYAGALPPGPERDHVLGRVAFAWSRTNPAAAARLVAEEISPGLAQEQAALSVVHQWLLQDAGMARAWIDAFPAGDLRNRAIAEWERARQGAQ